MSVGATGFLAAAAGTPLAQSKGADVDRAAQEIQAQQGQLNNLARAERAAGVGQTDEDQAASQRDADGRRIWEQPPPRDPGEEADPATGQPASHGKDPSGQCGTQLDLSG